MELRAQASKRECEKEGDRTERERERYCHQAVFGDCDVLERHVLRLSVHLAVP